MDLSTYRYAPGAAIHSDDYLLPRLLAILDDLQASPLQKRVFDLGCGNGGIARVLVERGWSVVGVDPSPSGIEVARAAAPGGRFEVGSCNDDLAGKFGRFPVVVSLEVVEHVYAPREFARCAFNLLEPGGWLIASTPYHGYWKNLALALAGRMDAHYAALWDHGHIKFWSIATLTALLREAGFGAPEFQRVGRLPPFAKSMFAVARKPL